MNILNNKPGFIDPTNDIIKRLKLVSTWKTNEKFDVKSLQMVSINIFSKAWRWFWGESGDTTLDFLNYTYSRAFEIINNFIYNKDNKQNLICKSIINDLNASLAGINNLKITYKDNRLMICSLDTLLQNININLLQLRLSNPEIFENN